MANAAQEALKKVRSGASAPAQATMGNLQMNAAVESPAVMPANLLNLGGDEVQADAYEEPEMELEDRPSRNPYGWIAGLEAEVVVSGWLMRVRARAGTSPAQMIEGLKAIDPAVKFRDSFPTKMGPREVKHAVVKVLQIRGGENKQIKMVAQGEKSVTVSVTKKGVDGFLGELKGLNKLSDEQLSEAEAAFVKGDATILLGPGQEFTVNYWTTDDGGHFYESLSADVAVEGAKA